MRASAPFRSTTAGVINRARILRPAVSAFPNGLAAGTERRRRRGPPAARGTNSFLRTWWARAGAERGSGGGLNFWEREVTDLPLYLIPVVDKFQPDPRVFR
jgi:hypothetical protein